MTLPLVNFEITPAADNETCQAHIAHALSLGLPEADADDLKHITIIANGPSAQDAPLDGPTVALNGAISLFLNSGRSPTYWAACDPQALVADFLPEKPPRDTIYLVASKCHPSVFAKLQGYDVRLWHINDHPLPTGTRKVKCASTVTLCVMRLFRKLGYRSFDVYGWDACYEERAPGVILHHASDPSVQAYPSDYIEVNVGAEMVDGEPTGGRWFKTSRAWAAELQDAIVHLHYSDEERVRVHGDGLIANRLHASAKLR